MNRLSKLALASHALAIGAFGCPLIIKPSGQDRVKISLEQIPEVKEPLAVHTLGAQVVAPPAMVQEILKTAAPGAELRKMGEGGVLVATLDNRVHAYIDPRSGSSRVFPALERLQPGQGLAARAQEMGARLAANEQLFPKDGAQVIARPAIVLKANRHERGKESGGPVELAGVVRLRRQIGGLPVFGPGSRAMIAVGADNNLHALNHRWRAANPSEKRVTSAPREKVRQAIVDQLAPVAARADVIVDRVSVGYYDGGKGFIQPVYRIHSRIPAPIVPGQKRAADAHLLSYVALAADGGFEPLPAVNQIVGKEPGAAPKADPSRLRQKAAPGDPTVGRYVVRNDNSDWVNDANEFWDGIQTAGNWFGSTIPFTDSQYYWAEPRTFTNEKDYWVNAVNIALTEVHGNWWYFTTLMNNADGVSLSGIPAPGYGGNANGALAFWIIHSCEVIPTATDESTSFDVWWNIFNGLHAVVGYRTEMWIDDDVGGPFGLAVGLGAPIVSAWMNEVVSNDSYDDGDTYQDGNRNMSEPMGRASSVSVCGNTDDTANQVGTIPAAGCLYEWWFDN
jgi:hypothetical protein